MKKLIFRKKPQIYRGPRVPNLIKNFFYSKRKKKIKITIALSAKYIYIYTTKYGFFWIASKNFS